MEVTFDETLEKVKKAIENSYNKKYHGDSDTM